MNDDWELLFTCNDNQEASVAKSVLEAEGIECVVQGENHRSMLGALGTYIELRVLVPREKWHAAQALFTVQAIETPTPEETEAPVSYTAKRRRIGFWLLVVFLGPGALVGLFELLKGFF